MAEEQQPIIIKKIVKGGHGHHGGAWKVAYADFVTAMMAFFLLLWLLSATTEEQRMGLADYFSPSLSNTRTGGGGDGMFGGSAIGQKNVLSNPGSPLLPSAAPNAGADPESQNEETNDTMLEGSDGGEKEGSASDARKKAAQLEEESFDAVAGAIKAAIENVPELKALSKHVIIEKTPEGLRIQIMDQKNYSMFPSGSSKMHEKTKELINMIGLIIKNLPNKISISGHTDAYPFTSRENYDNWDLSSERAHATRRYLINHIGIEEKRIANVVGKAATVPLIKDDPFAPQNRRVSITLLREHPLNKKKQKTK